MRPLRIFVGSSIPRKSSNWLDCVHLVWSNGGGGNFFGRNSNGGAFIGGDESCGEKHLYFGMIGCDAKPH